MASRTRTAACAAGSDAREATLQSLEPAALGRLAITGSRPSNAPEGVETCEIRNHSIPKVVQG
jgi:hypothetical protein